MYVPYLSACIDIAGCILVLYIGRKTSRPLLLAGGMIWLILPIQAEYLFPLAREYAIYTAWEWSNGIALVAAILLFAADAFMARKKRVALIPLIAILLVFLDYFIMHAWSFPPSSVYTPFQAFTLSIPSLLMVAIFFLIAIFFVILDPANEIKHHARPIPVEQD